MSISERQWGFPVERTPCCKENKTVQLTIFQPNKAVAMISICLLMSLLRQGISLYRDPGWIMHTSSNKINPQLYRWREAARIQSIWQAKESSTSLWKCCSGKREMQLWMLGTKFMDHMHSIYFYRHKLARRCAHPHLHIHPHELAELQFKVSEISQGELHSLPVRNRSKENACCWCWKVVSGRFSEKYLYFPPQALRTCGLRICSNSAVGSILYQCVLYYTLHLKTWFSAHIGTKRNTCYIHMYHMLIICINVNRHILL